MPDEHFNVFDKTSPGMSNCKSSKGAAAMPGCGNITPWFPQKLPKAALILPPRKIRFPS